MKIVTNISPKGEKIVIFSLYGPNRSSKMVVAQKSIFDLFNAGINQIECPFPSRSHGFFLDRIVESSIDVFDFLIIFDMDAVPINPDFLHVIYDKICDKNTVFGGAQQSNHISVNGSFQHVYVSPAFFSISKELYKNLGRPSFDHNYRGDCAEEITWLAKERGYNVALSYPSNVVDPCYDLDNGLKFGYGTTYGNLVYHGFCQGRSDSEERFVNKCNEVIVKYSSIYDKNFS